MKIWVVGISDCESNSTVAICSTKEIAKRELFKVRDSLVKEWQEQHEFWQKENRKFSEDMYLDMIKHLQGDDYGAWENYPHDCPYLCETELIEE